MSIFNGQFANSLFRSILLSLAIFITDHQTFIWSSCTSSTSQILSFNGIATFCTSELYFASFAIIRINRQNMPFDIGQLRPKRFVNSLSDRSTLVWDKNESGVIKSWLISSFVKPLPRKDFLTKTVSRIIIEVFFILKINWNQIYLACNDFELLKCVLGVMRGCISKLT